MAGALDSCFSLDFNVLLCKKNTDIFVRVIVCQNSIAVIVSKANLPRFGYAICSEV